MRVIRAFKMVPMMATPIVAPMLRKKNGRVDTTPICPCGAAVWTATTVVTVDMPIPRPRIVPLAAA